MQTRPSFINSLDWNLLTKKYRNNKKLAKIVKRIENDYPIQYAIGNIEFLDAKIDVNKNVLIPRFETELLVDRLSSFIEKIEFSNINILDICTGSGCIAIALKKKFKESNVYALDKSFKALRVARKNARKNKTKIKFKRCDILKTVTFSQKFSILVSNPPYVKLDEKVTPNTKYEPQMALYPGEDDIIFYKRILELSTHIMYKKNIIAFEIGSTQAKDICSYAKKIFPNSIIEVSKDYNGFDRFVFIFNNFE